MKKLVICLSLVTMCLLSSCGLLKLNQDKPAAGATLGIVTTPLDANNAVVRTQESLLGNLTADAAVACGVRKGYSPDLALINGGNLRIGPSAVNGVYPAGEINEGILEEINSFKNNVALVTVTGAQLKMIFERSAAGIGTGAFLQTSKEVRVSYNISLAIGQRVTSLKIKNQNVSPTANYVLAATDYTIGGGDSYTVFSAVDSSKKIALNERVDQSTAAYIRANTPVTPKIEGRIFVTN